MTHDHDVDHDTVVVDRGGSSMGTILGILGIIILLVAVWYFALGPGAGTGAPAGGGTTNPPPAASVVPSAAP